MRMPIRLLITGLVLLLLGACVQLPDEGPVVESEGRTDTRSDTGPEFVPPAPAPQASEGDIVKGFLDAMTANPLQTSSARKYLTREAAASWRPERSTITYAGATTPGDPNSLSVSVSLQNPQRLDSRGVWQGALSPEASTLDFGMTNEDNEWRIATPPDALIIPNNFFELHYRQVSLYFFDPSAQVLVPQPVYVPRGKQLATSLIRGLLAGPGQGLTGVARSFMPSDVSLELPEPASESGVFEIALDGDRRDLAPEAIELMVVQFAWTLRQDPSIKSLRITVGGTPVALPNGDTVFDVESGAEYDPTGAFAPGTMFGLRNGRLVTVRDGTVGPSAGPFGAADLGIRDFSVDLLGEDVAGVSADGTSVTIAPLGRDESAVPDVVVRGATDLLHPAWDHARGLWLVDRTSRGAEVTVVEGGRARTLTVPGISKQQVRDFLVSRDGSRIVAATRGPLGDQVVVARIVRDEQGRVQEVMPARTILSDDAEPLTIRDLGWRSPTEVLAVTSELLEIRTISIDGSPGTADADSANQSLREEVRSVVSSPTLGQPVYAITAEGGLIQLAPTGEPDSELEEGLTSLAYVG